MECLATLDGKGGGWSPHNGSTTGGLGDGDADGLIYGDDDDQPDYGEGFGHGIGGRRDGDGDGVGGWDGYPDLRGSGAGDGADCYLGGYGDGTGDGYGDSNGRDGDGPNYVALSVGPLSAPNWQGVSGGLE